METFICPWCGHKENSGQGMMEHTGLHPESAGLQCGTCWLPHQDGHRCYTALQRHVDGWRRDHAPNYRDWYPNLDGYTMAASAWASATVALWQEAEALHRQLAQSHSLDH